MTKAGGTGGGIGKRVRERVQQSMERAEEERKRELFKRRIELARNAVRDYRAKKIVEAVQAFRIYLKILEDWKDVPKGGLNPSLFSKTEDAAELLLISGIYWDLAKIYDRADRKDTKEFHHFLDKYVLFSMGMPFQRLSAETLRRYLWNDKPRHKSEFKIAYKKLGGSRCFVATSLIDVSHPRTLPRLRNFRDHFLSRYKWGRNWIAWYYRVGPALSALIDLLPNPMRRAIALGLDILGWIISGLFRFSRDEKRIRPPEN